MGLDQIPSTSPLGVGLDQIPSTSPLGVGLDQIPLNFPLGCGPGDPPPSQIPLNFPLGCGPGNLQGMHGYHPPPLETCCKACWDTTCKACWDTTPPPTPPHGQTDICTFATSLRTVINAVTDPGFPKEGYQTPKGRRQPIIWPFCSKNCMKMKKIGPTEKKSSRKVKLSQKQKCIPVECVPSAIVAVCFRGGEVTPPEQTPQSRPPFWEQTPPGEQAHPQEQASPCCKACWDTTCNACWDSTTPTPVNRITDTCKNITFATSMRTVTNTFNRSC